jgi:hypothetical protein
MRRLRPRITIRLLMITIGALALLFGIGVEARRRSVEEERRKSEWPGCLLIDCQTLAPFDDPYDGVRPEPPPDDFDTSAPEAQKESTSSGALEGAIHGFHSEVRKGVPCTSSTEVIDEIALTNRLFRRKQRL